MPQISLKTLSSMIGTANCPTIIDVRIQDDVEANPTFIPTSVRRSFKDVEAWGHEFSGQNTVIACHKGLKLSEGVAAHLRLLGIQSVALEGGNVAWHEAGLPTINALHEGSTWVTRERPKIDRIACPWLITRFIDKNAKFLYVKASEVANVAEKFNAIPYDIEGVKFTHNGDLCSFDTIIREFGLDIPALNKLALIVRGADTDVHSLSKECAGVFALSLGLSHLYQDDLAQLKAGMALYDALYAYCLHDKGEKHFWRGVTK